LKKRIHTYVSIRFLPRVSNSSCTPLPVFAEVNSV
jgi:hypothetical protein